MLGPQSRVGVYGLGRFGAFWAALLARRFSVMAYNRSDRPVPEGVRRVGLEELGQADCLWICSAISSLPEILPELAPHLAPGTVVADTCSVKVWPARWMQELLPPGQPLLATHPMFGPDSAKEGTAGLPMVLYPLQNSEGPAVFWTRSFREDYGLKVLSLSPEEHDRAAADTQGLTHLIGRLLDRLGAVPHPIGTRGYRALLDIKQYTGNDPWQLFLDLQRYNPYTPDMRRRLDAALSELEAELGPGYGVSP